MTRSGKRSPRPRLTQLIPPGPRSTFTVFEHTPGSGSWWHTRISDAIVGDEPEFVVQNRKTKEAWSPDLVAVAAAGEMNEATGAAYLTEWVAGIPTFAAVYISNGRQVFCVWATDSSQCNVVDPYRVECDARAALEKHRLSMLGTE